MVVDMGSKRSEMSNVVEKVALFTRMFSKNDEIIILEGMIKVYLKKALVSVQMLLSFMSLL